ncbi:hypothetical protein MJL81_33530, partial [Salmonella enterica subsp. enterica serovar Anatum]|nr:hypothetical protein [Salmonella enterica subsp. enterica serovar Anatum]
NVNSVSSASKKIQSHFIITPCLFYYMLIGNAMMMASSCPCAVAALFMVLANRYDWQLFLEVTGPGGSGKSILAEIATMLAGED